MDGQTLAFTAPALLPAGSVKVWMNIAEVIFITSYKLSMTL